MSELGRDLLSLRIPLDDISSGDRNSSRLIYQMSKRCFDIVATLAIAPLAIPVVAAAALLVRLDGGKAFYRQKRVGKGGVVFTLWKLRSMRPDAACFLERYLQEHPEARAEWEKNQKLRQDPRITRVGLILRKYSIDELPQLLNVLTGQMSLVGPRPFMPEQRQCYPGEAYFSMRPGLTGLWQVSERNGCTFTERALYDNKYASAMSFGVDLRILLRTVAVVLHGTGM